MSPIAGQLVSERFDYDGGRQVAAFVAPDVPEAIAFAGDGQLITSWAGAPEAADLPPTMMIGAHRLDDGRCGSGSTRQARVRPLSTLPLSGSPRMRSSSSGTFADGRNPGSKSRYLQIEPLY
jgi:hypothetical protein